tara:strand:- start:1536 stop:2483 length:948 start_codon:yes stop_codon:yes gene_type:complete
MLSDDTEHTLMVVECLTAHPSDVHEFQRALANKLRWWLLAFPAGVGFATARALLKLWIGFPSSRSGVFSAGNGPAMRSAIIGAYLSESPDNIESYVRASTELTHTDPKALVGALAVAYIAATPDNISSCWRALEGLIRIEPTDWPRILDTLKIAVAENWSMDDYLVELRLGNGVTGYVYHTVPVVLFAWFKWHDSANMYSVSLTEVLNSGGDTDTTGAIIGALSGARVGSINIPREWRSNIADWPRGASLIDGHVSALIKNEAATSPRWIFCLVRNLGFLVIILSHGFLRLFHWSRHRVLDPRSMSDTYRNSRNR